MNFIAVLFVLFVAGSAWAAPSKTCTIANPSPGSCTLTSITDSTCAEAGNTITCSDAGVPDNDTLFKLETGGRNARFRFVITTRNGAVGGYTITFDDGVNPPITSERFDATNASTGTNREYHAVGTGRNLRTALGNNFRLYDCPASVECATGSPNLEWEMVGAEYGCSSLVTADMFTCTPTDADTNCGDGFGAAKVGATLITAGLEPSIRSSLTMGGDWTFDGATTGSGIHMECGTSELNILTSAALPGLKVTLPSGFDPESLGGVYAIVNDGGTINVHGAWYAAPSGTGTLVQDPADAKWTVGQIVPCPATSGSDIVSDCPGDGAGGTGGDYNSTRYVGIRWDARNEVKITGGAGGNKAPYLGAMLAYMDTHVSTRKLLAQFTDLSYGTAGDIANDVWGSYRIADVGYAAGPAPPYWVVLDTHPGDVNPDGAPWTTRIDLRYGTTRIASSRGSRTIDLTETDLATNSVDGATRANIDATMFSGRWIRFRNPDVPTEWECNAYPIGLIMDNATTSGTAGDVVWLMGDADFNDGLRRDIAAGEEYIIDYGWKCGEEIVFSNPPHLTSATTTPGAQYDDSHVQTNGGSVNMFGAYLTQLQKWSFHAAQDVTLAWETIHDPVSDDPDGVAWMVWHTNLATFGPGNFIGGGSDLAGMHDNYLFIGNDTGTIHVRDTQQRHGGDDSFGNVAPDPTVVKTGDDQIAEQSDLFWIERFYTNAWSDSSSSGAVAEFNVSKASLHMSQTVHANSMDFDGGAAWIILSDPESCSLNDMFFVGGRGPAFSADADAGWDNGTRCAGGNTLISYQWMPGDTLLLGVPLGSYHAPRGRNFVARDIWLSNAGANRANNAAFTSNRMNSAQDGYFKHAYFSENINRRPSGTDAFVRNVGIFDSREWNPAVTPSRTGGTLNATGVGAGTSNADMTWDKMTFAYYPYGDYMPDVTGAVGEVENTNARSGLYLGFSKNVAFGQFTNMAFAYLDGYSPDATSQPTINASVNFGGLAAAYDTTTESFATPSAWCFFGNYGTNSQIDEHVPTDTYNGQLKNWLIGAGGMDYIQNVDPQFFDPMRGQWWPIEGSPWQEAGCGMQQGAGNSIRLYGAKVYDLHREAQDDFGAQYGPSGDGAIGVISR